MKRRILSGSNEGQPIKVGATTSPGTLVHTVGIGGAIVTLFAINTDSTDRLLTIQFGGTTEPDNSIEVTVPAVGGIGGRGLHGRRRPGRGARGAPQGRVVRRR